MSLSRYHAPQNEYLEGEHDTAMLESCLTFLTTLVDVRTNLGKCQILHNEKNVANKTKFVRSTDAIFRRQVCLIRKCHAWKW